MKDLDRIPLDGELFLISYEVHVLETFASKSGQVVVTTILSQACLGHGDMRCVALDHVRAILENDHSARALRKAAAVVCLERKRVEGRPPSNTLVEVYEIAPLRALFDVLEELGTVYCGACRAMLNADDDACYRCGAAVRSEAA